MNSANLVMLRTGMSAAFLCLLGACDTPSGYGGGYDNGYRQQPAYPPQPPAYGPPPGYGAPPRYPPPQPEYRPPPPGYGQRPQNHSEPAPNFGPTAPAIANQNCIRAAAEAFKKPWQTIVLGASQRMPDGNYAVQLTSGTDGRRVVCVSSGMGNVLGLR
ncbi:hypothetical protein WKW79_33680 [Variovorax robiniae]|uniref:Lipoprotein n=1 Tax=Variovorax robiniae TaxID=1836199 RepID=A0ABU8XIZ7_9BURK